MHLAMWPTPCMTGQVHLLVYIYIYIKTHDSESRGQEEAAVRDE